MQKLLKSYFKEYPQLEKYSLHPANKEIFKNLGAFVNDKSVFLASLVQNPYGKTKKLPEIKKIFGKDVSEKIVQLGKLQERDPSVFKQYSLYRKAIILFLINYHIIFEKEIKNKETKKILSKEKISYAMKLLEKLDITEIRILLEDKFFSVLEPEIYNNYRSILKITKRKYLSKQKESLEDFKNILKKNNIYGRIESRVKTICSIHTKITKKNLLFSQILDVIGIRVILRTKEDCYKTMMSILKNSNVMVSRIKDYVAIPKNNGYQSIHLTVIKNGQPVEIQIRTEEMHQKAQYGIASHFDYKKDNA